MKIVTSGIVFRCWLWLSLPDWLRAAQAIIMATHSPLLMAYPEATLLQISGAAVSRARLEETDHFRLMQQFWREPAAFVRSVLET